MKKLYTLFSMLFVMWSLQAKAQSTSLTVNNATGCEICFYIEGRVSPGCLPATSTTGVICIPPGGTVNYPTTAAAPFSPALPPGSAFVTLCWYNYRPYICPDRDLIARCIWDPCASLPTMGFFEVFGADCRLCANTTGTWTVVGSAATVTFN